MLHVLLLTVVAVGAVPTFEITGLVAPVFTPLASDGTLDLSIIPSQAAYLNSTGVKWVFTAGSTGESVDLTTLERMALAEEWIKVAKTFDMRVIVHVGTDSVVDAKTMAAHAEENGANAVAAMPPTYIRPGTLNALVVTMAAIAGAAPTTPFYYYHIPSKTGVDFPMRDFVEAADAAIPNLRGIKFTNYALDDFQLTSTYTFTSAASLPWRKGVTPNMMFGRDQFLLGALVYGCQAAVGTTYNFNAELQYKVIDAYNNGDMVTARAAQEGTASLVKILDGGSLKTKLGGAYVWKMIMDAAGMSMGPARLPYIPPTAAATAGLKEALVGWCGALAKGLQPTWCQHVLL